MAFTLPNFNMTYDFYQAALPPPAGPATYTGCTGQIYNIRNGVGCILRIPIGGTQAVLTDLGWIIVTSGHWNNTNFPDLVFLIFNPSVVHYGFGNEYRACGLIPYSLSQLPTLVTQYIA